MLKALSCTPAHQYILSFRMSYVVVYCIPYRSGRPRALAAPASTASSSSSSSSSSSLIGDNPHRVRPTLAGRRGGSHLYATTLSRPVLPQSATHHIGPQGLPTCLIFALHGFAACFIARAASYARGRAAVTMATPASPL